jgi:UDP-glucuronate decarboxylase
MKILVAGGAGFLGSNLCRKLLDNGNEVICLDNLLTGSRKNIAPFLKNPDFKFIKHDITKILPKNITADEVFHLASPASPNIRSPKSYHALCFETMRANTDGTWNLCEFASKNKAKLLLASTSEIYGDPVVHPQTEEYRGNTSSIGPRAVYDEAKRFGETIVSTYVRKKNLDARIVRIFNTYGPGMDIDDGRVVTEFIKAVMNKKALPVEGDGKETRSFCFVDDLILGFLAAMRKGIKGEVYNLGNPSETSIIELAKIIPRLMDAKVKIEFLDYPEDSPLRRRPDITKAKEKLGWEPKITLEEGLKRTIQYFQKNT